MADLESVNWEFLSIGELLTTLKKEFEKRNNKLVKVVEFRQLEQGSQTIDKFVQIFKRITKKSKYKRRMLVKEFKREINNNIRYRLIKIE